MTLHVYADIEQRSSEWFDVRRGMVTASSVGQLITTKTLMVANNDYSRGLIDTLTAERITGHTEEMYVNNDMMRGIMDEPIARDIYSKHYAPVSEVAFMVEDTWGFRIGASPDGLVGNEGGLEIKSRRQRKQLQTILADEVPAENLAQIQCSLLVSGRSWWDYVSYCAGMPLYVKRVFPDERWHDAIIAAVAALEDASHTIVARYNAAIEGLTPTERIDYDMEIVI